MAGMRPAKRTSVNIQSQILKRLGHTDRILPECRDALARFLAERLRNG